MRFLKICLLLLLLLSINAASAQEAEPAQLRLFQIFTNSATATLDDAVIVDSLLYPFASEYVPVTPGAHTLTIADDSGKLSNKSVDFEAEAGHRYAAVALNNTTDYTDYQISLIDETELLTGAGAPNANHAYVLVTHDVVGAPALDIYINDQLVVQGLEFGTSLAFATPVGEYYAKATPSGDAETVIYEQDYTGLADVQSLVALIGETPDSFFVATSLSSDLSVSDYLVAQNDQPDGYFKTFYQALVQSDVLKELTDDGQFTLFIPDDDVFASVPDAQRDALLSDPQALGAYLRQYIATERVLPGDLPTHDTLPTLAGTDMALTFPTDNYWTLNGTAHIIDNIRLANGVIYQLDSLLPPAS